MKPKERTAFLFYFDWANILLDEYPYDLRHSILEAILLYITKGEEPTDPTVKYSMFTVIKKRIAEDTEAYAEKCERVKQARREAGLRGNEKRWNLSQKSQKSQMSQTSLDSDSDSDNDRDKDINKTPISKEIYPLTGQGGSVPHFNRVDMEDNSPCECRTATGEQCKRRATWEIDEVRYCNQHAKDIIGSTSTDKRFKRPTLNEVREYIASQSYSVDAEAFIDFYEAKGWRVGNNPMKDWKAAVRTWERRNREEGKANPKKTTAPNGVKLGAGEWIDANGMRTYGSGVANIPLNAPPRPGDKYTWDAATQSWIYL